MGASGGLMAASYGVQGLSAAGGAYAQSQAQRSMGDYQRTLGGINAGYANLSGQDAVTRGAVNANRVASQGRAAQGSQRASLSAQGIDVNSGSAADAQASTQAVSELDQLMIKNNAWKEAWGFKVQAANAEAQGQMQGMAADNAARNTLLTGGMQAIGYGLKAFGSYRGIGGAGGVGQKYKATEDWGDE